MNMLNLCIDIDGTITDPYYWLGITNQYFNKKVIEQQVTRYDIHEVMGIEREVYEKFYNENKFKIHSVQEIREDAKSILKRIHVNHNVYFVTARGQDLEMLTHVYLRKHEIPYDGLYLLGSHYKVNKAKELNCSLFIEDNYDNAMQLANEGFKVLLLDTYYNRKPLNENIIRVDNWNEIYTIINEMALSNQAI